MQDMCPKCGSLDVMEKYKQPWILICNDCGHEFPNNSYKSEPEDYLEQIERESEESDLRDVEEEFPDEW